MEFGSQMIFASHGWEDIDNGRVNAEKVSGSRQHEAVCRESDAGSPVMALKQPVFFTPINHS